LKGAIFDWDGTLASIDDREFYCINSALAEQGESPVNKQFYIDNYYRRAYELGTGPRMVLKTALTGRGPATVESAYESYRKIFQESADKATLQTGTLPILNALKQAGFKIGIATMRYTRWVVESELEHLAVAPLVDILQTREDLRSLGQEWGALDSLDTIVSQRAQLVTRALRGLQLGPSDVFLVGDSWWDVRAGRQIGVRTVLVRTGFAAYNDFSNEHPDLVVSTLLELREVLEKRGRSI
jgi:phosphoglycolate phosphatase-like HAD superfamily hydrolase